MRKASGPRLARLAAALILGLSGTGVNALTPPSAKDTAALTGSQTTELYSPTQFQEGGCEQLDPPTALSGWKRWSDISTWPGRDHVPGTARSTDRNVTITCGEFVLYDMQSLPATGESAVHLDALFVEGHLMFLDDASLPELALEASFIIVTGKFSIGSEEQHFRQKASIRLTGDSSATLPGLENVGSMVLAAVGGEISFYGMPGGPETPSWVSLTAMAEAGSTTLEVDQDVSEWPVGGQVVIASTDFDPGQSETAFIVAASNTTLLLDRPLEVSHFAPNVPTWHQNIFMPMIGMENSCCYKHEQELPPQAAEVALLSRNILVTTKNESIDGLKGGHVMVYNTQADQAFFGTEFAFLGQQGVLGRYPLHFHMCGSMPGSIVRANSVHDSLQRGYVIHASHNMLAEDNISFNTTGHAFMLEDGIEQNNTIAHNLLINSNPAQVLIDQDPANTDDEPSCFWSASPLNSFMDNVAVGCDSGFWLELNSFVRGFSAGLPGAESLVPFTAELGGFSNNTAHSNRIGLRLYKEGYKPLQNQTFSGFQAYKNDAFCISFHGSMQLIIDGAMLADCNNGIEFNGQGLNTVQNSIIIGQSSNLGNPLRCGDPGFACEPATGTCSAGFNHSEVPDRPGKGFRTVPHVAPKEGGGFIGISLAANTAVNNVFSGFNSSCWPQGALGINDQQPGALFATGVAWSNTFVNTLQQNRIYVDPRQGPEQDQYWVLKDADGSISGEVGHIVADGSAVLQPPPPSNESISESAACDEKPEWGAFFCRDLCFRSLYVLYSEPGVGNATNVTVPFNGTSVTLVRRADSAITTTAKGIPFNAGSLAVDPETNQSSWRRFESLNILAGQSYDVDIVGGLGMLPSNVTYGYADLDQPSNPACNVSSRFAFQKGISAAFQ